MPKGKKTHTIKPPQHPNPPSNPVSGNVNGAVFPKSGTVAYNANATYTHNVTPNTSVSATVGRSGTNKSSKGSNSFQVGGRVNF